MTYENHHFLLIFLYLASPLTTAVIITKKNTKDQKTTIYTYNHTSFVIELNHIYLNFC